MAVGSPNLIFVFQKLFKVLFKTITDLFPYLGLMNKSTLPFTSSSPLFPEIQTNFSLSNTNSVINVLTTNFIHNFIAGS